MDEHAAGFETGSAWIGNLSMDRFSIGGADLLADRAADTGASEIVFKSVGARRHGYAHWASGLAALDQQRHARGVLDYRVASRELAGVVAGIAN